jgi:hypothetical protein
VIHAELANSALQAYGVDAAVLGETLNHQQESPGWSIDLMVKHADVARGRHSRPRGTILTLNMTSPFR